MRIYNEVVIDMNPESSSYGETLHEDSYEYNGEMILFRSRNGDFEGTIAEWEAEYGMSATSYDITLPNHADIPPPPGYHTNSTYYGSNPNYQQYSDQFTYTGGEGNWEFAPTMEEFQTSITETGGYGEMEAGFTDLMEGDLGEWYGKPLEFMEKGFSLGKAGVGLKTGASLYDVKQSMDRKKAESNLAYSGSLAFQEKKAQKGIMADYKQQQEQLALGYETDVSSFWKSAYDEMYGDVDVIEGDVASDRRLKDNITIVDKSPSGINIYTFNYKNPYKYGYGLYRGVMSDDVPSDAVVSGDNGYDLVDYSKLDVNFERILN